MRAGVLTLAMTAVLAFAAPHPVSTAPKRPPAQLGFIVFCRTSMTDVTARLGPGAFVAQRTLTRSRGVGMTPLVASPFWSLGGGTTSTEACPARLPLSGWTSLPRVISFTFS